MGDALGNNTIYRNIYTWVDGLTPPGTEWVAYLVASCALVLIAVNGLFVMGTWYTYIERRLLGRFQGRLGPNRAGPFGLLQPIADAVKLLSKEAIQPESADHLLFRLAPVMMLVATFAAVAVLPFGAGTYVADLNIGILYISAVSGLTVIAILTAGWASANRYALFGSMRAVAGLLSYEVPVVLVLLAVTAFTGSMSLVDVVEAQRIPYLVLMPLGAFVFFLGISAELNRVPFDLAEAESEIIAGYHTEYSGMQFGTFYLAEFTNVIVASAFFVILFLEGWRGPFLPSYAWFFLKVGGVAFLFIWVRATVPRLRIDQVLNAAWKFLLPLALLNAMAITLARLVWPEPTTNGLWLIAGVNWGLAIPTVLLFGRTIVGEHRGVPLRSIVLRSDLASPVLMPNRSPLPKEAR